MANADFSQNQNTPNTVPGGFDAGSYREAANRQTAVPLTPLQKKLAALEEKLSVPAAGANILRTKFLTADKSLFF
mgnify:CR=1 FL=1